MDYNLILQRVKADYTALLKDNLAGIYVHGSVAFGCFDWGRSDIDYIAVVSDALPLDVKTALMQKTMQINETAPPRGLEMSVVLKEHCLNFIYPAPYELHFSNSHREAVSGFDKDLAAHFTVIKHTGIVLCGEPIDRVFGDVPREFYFDSIKSDIENARTEIEHNQAYYVLNLCRVLAFKQDGLILPKAAGGEWALKKIGDKYGGIINAALKGIKTDSGLALEFCDYILEKIRS